MNKWIEIISWNATVQRCCIYSFWSSTVIVKGGVVYDYRTCVWLYPLHLNPLHIKCLHIWCYLSTEQKKITGTAKSEIYCYLYKLTASLSKGKMSLYCFILSCLLKLKGEMEMHNLKSVEYKICIWYILKTISNTENMM